MKFSFAPVVGLLAFSAFSLVTVTRAQAATGTIVVVADGVSPQVLEMGKGYLRRADEDPQLKTAFDDMQDKGHPATVEADAISQMKGLLQTAHDHGYATGLVTTEDVTKEAPLFYNVPGDVAANLIGPDAPYDFLAGGGSAKIDKDARAKMMENQNTYVASSTDLDGELQGKVLATVAPEALHYSLDRDPAQESALSELATTAMDMLVSGEKPFLLVIHDGLTQKALQTHDTPALFEQFRELNSVLADAMARRVDEPNIKVAAVMTGGSIVPAFTTTVPEEQNNIYYWISNLQKSYAGAGQELKGKTVEEITAFADADTGEYKGWDVSAADKAKIAAGDLDAEKAIRTSYEPVLKIKYTETPTQPFGLAVGFDTLNGVVTALKSVASAPAK